MTVFLSFHLVHSFVFIVENRQGGLNLRIIVINLCRLCRLYLIKLIYRDVEDY